MNILDYEECIEKMESVGINVKDYNNYIISQVISTIWSELGDKVIHFSSAVDNILMLKCKLCDELKELDCNAKEFDSLGDSIIYVMVHSLMFSIEELCELFHASPLVISNRISNLGIRSVDDEYIGVICSRISTQILEYRNRK